MNRLNRLHAEQQEVCSSIWGQQLRRRGHQTESSSILQEDRIYPSIEVVQLNNLENCYRNDHIYNILPVKVERTIQDKGTLANLNHSIWSDSSPRKELKVNCYICFYSLGNTTTILGGRFTDMHKISVKEMANLFLYDKYYGLYEVLKLHMIARFHIQDPSQM